MVFLFSFFEFQARCEAILRSEPHSRIAKELHLAAIDAEEEKQIKDVKKAAGTGIAVAAAIGLAAGAASLLLSSKKR